MTGASPFDTEAALIETIKGIFLGNDMTRTGGAFHKLIEGEFTFNEKGKYYLADDIAFTPAQAAPAFEFKAQHANMVHEVPVVKAYQVGEHMIMISGRADGIEGIEIRDTKTKYRSINFQEYLDGFQWRFYLDQLELDTFHYDVFEVKGFTELREGPPFFLPDVQFLPAESIKCERYDGMTEDCLALLHEFMGYIHNRNFYHLLKQVNETPVL